jgi:hypothetical protein
MEKNNYWRFCYFKELLHIRKTCFSTFAKLVSPIEGLSLAYQPSHEPSFVELP